MKRALVLGGFLLYFCASSALATAVVDVSTLASAGDGLSWTTAWSGWETSLNSSATPANVEIYFPAGYYTQNAQVTIKTGWMIRGAGKLATNIKSSFSGTAFLTSTTPNTQVERHISISDLLIDNSNTSNNGSGILEVAGTYINISRVKISHFKYGITLNQSEIVEIDSCDIEAQSAIGLWIVNGGDYDSTHADIDILDASSPPQPAASGRSNRISVHDSQFNEGDTVHGIADDGGTAHHFYGNNFNDCLHSIRLVSTTSATIESSEIESSHDSAIWLTDVSFFGAGLHANIGLRIVSNTIIPESGQAAIEFTKNGGEYHTALTIADNTITVSSVSAAIYLPNARRVILHGNNLTGSAMVDNTSSTYIADEK